MTKEHPIKIMFLVSKNFWMLIIPLIRGLLSMKESVYDWLRGTWFDILIVIIIFVSAYLRWYFCTYMFSEDSIIARSGVFIKRETRIPYKNITAVSAERRFLYRPLNAVHLYFDTNSGFLKMSDLKIIVTKKNYENVFHKLLLENKIHLKTTYKPSRLNLIFFSIVFSSSLSGVIIIATTIYQAGEIVGTSLEKMIVDTATDLINKIVIGIPPVVLGAVIVIIAGWVFSFATNMLRYIGFVIKRQGEKIFIKTGFFTKRRYYINALNINYAEIRQNLPMKIFRVMSVHVNCAGYGKAKNELPVFVPITTKNQVLSSLRYLLPEFKAKKPQIKPPLIVLFGYIMIPVYIMVGIPIVAYLIYYFFPFWRSLVIFGVIMAEIPTVYLLIVQLYSFFTTGISCGKNNICLSYCSIWHYHTIMIPRNKIATITLMQNFFQIFSNTCHVIINSEEEFCKTHFIRSMPIAQLKEFLTVNGFKFETLEFFSRKKSELKKQFCK